MAKLKKINRNNLSRLFDLLNNSGKTILAPKKKGEKVFFSIVRSIDEVATDYIQTAMSAKSAVFPKVEELFRYYMDGGNVRIEDPDMSKEDFVIFGLRPCDAASFEYLAKFFLNENPDYHFQKRLGQTTLISIGCKNADQFCFCTSVGGGPGDTTGSDIMLTDMGDFYYAEVLTEKGSELLTTASQAFEDSQEMDKSKYLADVPLKFDLEKVKNNIDALYNSPLWMDNSLACLGCGACAFSCPTCTCFDIQEDGNIDGGSRLRCWDTCAIGIFTLHASGHNPRPVQSSRWRHRIRHKFEYTVNTHNTISCVGCGRCIRICPAQMNILETVQSIQEA